MMKAELSDAISLSLILRTMMGIDTLIANIAVDCELLSYLLKCKSNINTHTQSHNHFMALLTLSGTTRVNRYQKVHFAIFWISWSKMKITQADTPTIRMDCHPIQTNWCLTSAISTIFMQDALPYTTLPIYPGLEAPNMLACIPGGLVCIPGGTKSNLKV